MMLPKNLLKPIRSIRTSPLYLNSLYISLASLLGSVAGFLFWAVASRLYSSSTIGIASAVISSLNLIMMISLVGLNTSMIRFYPEYKERALTTTFLIVPISAIVISLAYLLIITNVSQDMKEIFSSRSLILLFVLFSVIGAIYRIFETALIVMREGRNYLLQNLLFGSRFIFLPLLVSLGALGILSSFGLGTLLGVLYSGLLIYQILTNSISNIHVDRKYLSVAFKFSLANYIASILRMTPNQIMPTIILSVLGSNKAAYYYITFTLGNMILLVPNALNTSFFVEGSYGQDVKKLLKRVTFASYVYLIPVVVFVLLFGDLLLMLFGKEYVEGFKLLKIIVISSFFVILVNFYTTIFNIQKKVHYVVMLMFARALLYLGLAYPLMIKYDILGIGYSWLFTHAILAILGVVFIRFLSD